MTAADRRRAEARRACADRDRASAALTKRAQVVADQVKAEICPEARYMWIEDALAAERRRALLGLARWAHKWLGPDHLDDDDRVIFIAALECAASEARRRARGKS